MDAASGDGRRLGVLRIAGPDARRFLQGQLSNDVTALVPGGPPQYAGLHNPQGRVLALLRLVAIAGEEICAFVPETLLEPVAATLRRYVLRAKLSITVMGADEARALLPADAPDAAHAIAAGLPQVYPATSAQFVAQMLNLDCIGAISFSKGCYTGQEVIARAHYRGRVKRRMQRFACPTPLTAAPGDTLLLADGRTAQLVDSVLCADGHSEFLAVAPLPPAASASNGAPASSAPPPEPTITTATTGTHAVLASAPIPVDSTPLPLPYAFPE